MAHSNPETNLEHELNKTETLYKVEHMRYAKSSLYTWTLKSRLDCLEKGFTKVFDDFFFGKTNRLKTNTGGSRTLDSRYEYLLVYMCNF